MNRINLNDLARDVTLREGQKRNLTIGDVKECQRLTFEELVNEHESIDILAMLDRYKK